MQSVFSHFAVVVEIEPSCHQSRMTCWQPDVPVRRKASQEALRDSELELYDKLSWLVSTETLVLGVFL